MILDSGGVGSNNKSACLIRETRSLTMNTEIFKNNAFGAYIDVSCGADEDVAVRHNRTESPPKVGATPFEPES